MGAGGSPAVPTFVIGVFSPGMAAQTAQTNLDVLAKAGQNSTTATAVVIDTGQDVAAALQNALKSVQSKAIACDYQVAGERRRLQEGQRQLHQRLEQRHRDRSRSRSTGPTAPGAISVAAGITTRIPPPARRPRSPPARRPARRSRPDLNGHVNVILGCPTIDVN